MTVPPGPTPPTKPPRALLCGACKRHGWEVPRRGHELCPYMYCERGCYGDPQLCRSTRVQNVQSKEPPEHITAPTPGFGENQICGSAAEMTGEDRQRSADGHASAVHRMSRDTPFPADNNDAIAEENAAASEESAPDTACRLCRNHNLKVWHYKLCPYEHCECLDCSAVKSTPVEPARSTPCAGRVGRRSYKCGQCWVHGKEILRQGHKECPHEKCECGGCLAVKERRLKEAKQRRIDRMLAKKRHADKRHLEDTDKGRSASQRNDHALSTANATAVDWRQQCAQCRVHGKEVLRQGHRPCPHEQCDCKPCQGVRQRRMRRAQKRRIDRIMQFSWGQNKRLRKNTDAEDDSSHSRENAAVCVQGKGNTVANLRAVRPGAEGQSGSHDQARSTAQAQPSRVDPRQQCGQCRVHGKEVLRRGHKQCPHEKCGCKGCLGVRRRRLQEAQQRRNKYVCWGPTRRRIQKPAVANKKRLDNAAADERCESAAVHEVGEGGAGGSCGAMEHGAEGQSGSHSDSRPPVILSAYRTTMTTTSWKVRTAETAVKRMTENNKKNVHPFVGIRACCTRCLLHGTYSEEGEIHVCPYASCKTCAANRHHPRVTELTVLIGHVLLGPAGSPVVLHLRKTGGSTPSSSSPLQPATPEDTITVPGLGRALLCKLAELPEQTDDMPPPILKLGKDEEAEAEDGPINAFVKRLIQRASKKVQEQQGPRGHDVPRHDGFTATDGRQGDQGQVEDPDRKPSPACARCGATLDHDEAQEGHVCHDLQVTICTECDTAVEWDKLCLCYQAGDHHDAHGDQPGDNRREQLGGEPSTEPPANALDSPPNSPTSSASDSSFEVVWASSSPAQDTNRTDGLPRSTSQSKPQKTGARSPLNNAYETAATPASSALDNVSKSEAPSSPVSLPEEEATATEEKEEKFIPPTRNNIPQLLQETLGNLAALSTSRHVPPHQYLKTLNNFMVDVATGDSSRQLTATQALIQTVLGPSVEYIDLED